MLHLRLRVPDDLLEEVLADLADDPTVTNVACVPDCFRSPVGAMVLADVARENATAVIGRLRRLRLEQHGSITVEPIETILAHDAQRAERDAPGSPDDGVVWETVEQRLRQDSRLSWSFVSFMTLATMIAGAGRILDQPILIVGAMVVGPEFSPIAAICFALARRKPDMLPAAVRSLALGMSLATAIAAASYGVAHALGGFTHHEAATGVQTDFIVSPDAWSFVVALLAGVAGTLSLTTEKSGPLVGVFISVTTIPAVGTTAVCIAAGVWSEVGSALAQLGINIAGMVIAGTVTLLVQALAWRRISRHTRRAHHGLHR